MKYELTRTKSIHEVLHVFADSPHEALKAAERGDGILVKSTPQTRVDDSLIRIGQDGVPVTEFTREAACENCEITIFEGEEYKMTEDDCYLCPKCAAACQEAQE